MTRTLNANALTHSQGFYKANADAVAFSKTGSFSVSTATRLAVEVGGQAIDLAALTAVDMPASPVAGTDYAIWLQPDGTLQASTSHTSAPVSGSRKIGGFHYAPGGNATGTSGGNTTPQINEYSFWDLKFRPACPDPRGMALIADGFWCDIYLTGVDAITNGTSKYNVTMADGSSPPKIPSQHGGDGTTTYGSFTWFEAMELAAAFGKRAMTQQEFMAAAYGSTQASSIGSDQVSTILNAAYTSRWGIIQATGVLWTWGRQRGGAKSSSANTEGRGYETDAPNASRFGGSWPSTSDSGSRASSWSYAASYSHFTFGLRAACDHLQLV